MPNTRLHHIQLVRSTMASLMAMLLLMSTISWSMVTAGNEFNAAAESNAAQVPNLFQEASSPSTDSKAQSANGVRTLLTDSGELTIMSKRRSGFLPSRGKKDADTFGAEVADEDQYDDEAARLAFLSEAAKRAASGFMPMRGRKSSAEMMELMEKRRIQSAFMPMRGRKWSGQPESAASTANAWYPRFYHQIPFGAPVAKLGEQTPILLSSNFRDEQDQANLEKRKGMGFFGARGKRHVA